MSIAPAVELQDGNAKEKSSADRTVLQAVTIDQTPMPRALAAGGDTHVSQDLREFLGNWFKLGDGNISTATTGTVFSVNLPGDFVYQTQIRPKILGYQGYSADHVVRFLINANDNHACRLIFWQMPFINVSGLLMGDRTNDVFLYSQLEHTTLDVATESGIDITVPWKYHLPYYDIYAATGGTGYNVSAMTVAMSIYAPLLAGLSGSTSFNYSVYVRAIPETIKLYNPCLNPDAPGSQRSQMGDSKIYRKRETGAGLGTWGQTGSTVSVAGVKLLKISDLTKPSWYLKVAANMLEFMGYSKPKMSERNQLFYQSFSTNRAQLNCDGEDTSANLALSSTNSVIPMPLMGIDHDELSLEYLVRKPSYYTSINWSSSNTTGTVLFGIGNHPTNFFKSVAVGANTVYASGPMTYLTNFFRYYRGPIMLRFLFNKTPYHQGRLQVTYQPLDFNLSPVAANPNNSVYLHREIIDVSEETDVEFLMPYTFNAPYCETLNASGGHLNGIGLLQVLVLNELVAPSTCSSSISILVEVCAGPGFEFAVPCAPLASIASTTYPTTDNQRSQANSGVSIHRDRTPGGKVRTFGYTTRSFDYAATCIGEPTMSLRQLLLTGTTMYPGATVFSSTDSYFYIRPSSIGVWDATHGILGFGGLDYYSLLAPLFALSRGGVRIEFRTATLKSNEFWVDTMPVGITNGVTYSIAQARSGTTLAIFPPNNRKAQCTRTYLEPNSYTNSVLVPNYCNLPCHFNAVNTFDLSASVYTVNEPVGFGYDPRILGVRCYSSNISAVYSLRRSMGEDFQMACFIGVPYWTLSAPDVVPKASEISEGPLDVPSQSLGSVAHMSKSAIEAARLPAAIPVQQTPMPSLSTKTKNL